MHKALKTFIPTVTNMIRADHTHVLAMFHQYEIDTSPGTKRALVDTICLGPRDPRPARGGDLLPGDARALGRRRRGRQERSRARRDAPADRPPARHGATRRGLRRDRHGADARRPPPRRRRGDDPAAGCRARPWRSPRGARRCDDEAAPRAGRAAHARACLEPRASAAGEQRPRGRGAQSRSLVMLLAGIAPDEPVSPGAGAWHSDCRTGVQAGGPGL